MKNTGAFIALAALGGIILATNDKSASTGTSSPKGNSYPAGSIFYNPTTGEPAAFVINNAPYGNLEVSINEWGRYYPGVALPRKL